MSGTEAVKANPVTIDMNEAPGAIRESIRSTLKARGYQLPEALLIELGNNVAHVLFSIELPEGK